MDDLLLRVRDLRTYFYIEEGLIKAVDGVDLDISRGETLGLVGESGCGKSVTARSIMQLVKPPRGKIVSGAIDFYRGGTSTDLASLGFEHPEMRRIRGKEIAMIFQEPMTSLNPVFTIGFQIMEAVKLHQEVSQDEAREIAIEMLAETGLSSPREQVNWYPHQLSGGMRQRVMIAMALCCHPSLLIADEPTTALDVTIEAQILELMKDLQRRYGMSILMITHNLGVIADMCDRVSVMYLGKIVETGTTDDIFFNAQHPYTVGLLRSIPQVGLKRRLDPIKGSVARMTDLPEGCYFAPRCPHAMQICREKEPPMYDVGDGQRAKCWLCRGGDQ